MQLGATMFLVLRGPSAVPVRVLGTKGAQWPAAAV